MTFLTVLSMILLSILIILLSILSVIRDMICGNNLNWLLNLNLIYETLWTGVRSGLLISMLGKLSWFRLTSPITMILLMWEWIGLFLRKNHLLRCLVVLIINHKNIFTVTMKFTISLTKVYLQSQNFWKSLFILRITIEGLECSMENSSKNHLLKDGYLVIKYAE